MVSKHEPLHIHANKIHDAAAYPPVDRLDLGVPSTIDDVAKFVVEYINSDVVGCVGNTMTVLEC